MDASEIFMVKKLKKKLIFLLTCFLGLTSELVYAEPNSDGQVQAEEDAPPAEETVPALEKSPVVQRIEEWGPLLEESLKKAEMQKAAEFAEKILDVNRSEASVETIRKAYIDTMGSVAESTLLVYVTRAYEILISFKK
jgi:hypothetical protein